MKIFVDTNLTVGTELLFLKSNPWTDFNDKSKILGTTVTVISVQNEYEKINVKIPKTDLILPNVNTKIEFVNLTGTVYNMNNKTGVSFKADDVAADFKLMK